MSYSFALLFLQGFLSFFTPCVLPLLPAYLGYISGQSASELRSGAKKARLIVNTLFFILGFTLVFIALGASASFIGSFLLGNMDAFRFVSGILIVFFGIVMLEILPINFLLAEHRPEYTGRYGGPVGAAVLGMAFSFGWTPCIGPVLSGVLLMLSSSNANVLQGTSLLLAYSLGLGLPFVLVSVFAKALLPKIQKLSRHTLLIKRISGVILIIMGILVMNNSLAIFATL